MFMHGTPGKNALIQEVSALQASDPTCNFEMLRLSCMEIEDRNNKRGF